MLSQLHSCKNYTLPHPIYAQNDVFVATQIFKSLIYVQRSRCRPESRCKDTIQTEKARADTYVHVEEPTIICLYLVRYAFRRKFFYLNSLKDRRTFQLGVCLCQRTETQTEEVIFTFTYFSSVLLWENVCTPLWRREKDLLEKQKRA